MGRREGKSRFAVVSHVFASFYLWDISSADFDASKATTKKMLVRMNIGVFFQRLSMCLL